MKPDFSKLYQTATADLSKLSQQVNSQFAEPSQLLVKLNNNERGFYSSLLSYVIKMGIYKGFNAQFMEIKWFSFLG
jgi:hypothetical protein